MRKIKRKKEDVDKVIFDMLRKQSKTNKGRGIIQKRILSPELRHAYGLLWEATTYYDLLKAKLPVVITGYGTLCADELEHTEEEKNESRRKHSLSLSNKIDPVRKQAFGDYVVDCPDFAVLTSKEEKRVLAWVEAKTRPSQWLWTDTSPVEPDVVDTHLGRNGKQPKYYEPSYLFVAFETFPQETIDKLGFAPMQPLQPKVLWAVIDDRLAVDLKFNNWWGREMYNPPLKLFNDNALKPLGSELRALG